MLEKTYPVSEKLTTQLKNSPITNLFNIKTLRPQWFNDMTTEQQERLADIFKYCFENGVIDIYQPHLRHDGSLRFDTYGFEYIVTEKRGEAYGKEFIAKLETMIKNCL